MSASSRHSGPTSAASVSRGTGVGEAKITASTRPIQARQRASRGSSGAGSNQGWRLGGAMSRAPCLEPIEPEQWPAGELARGAERHQALEEAAGRPLRAEAAKLGEGARRDGVVGEERAQAGRAALAAQRTGERAQARGAAGEREGALVREAGGVGVGGLAGRGPAGI